MTVNSHFCCQSHRIYNHRHNHGIVICECRLLRWLRSRLPIRQAFVLQARFGHKARHLYIGGSFCGSPGSFSRVKEKPPKGCETSQLLSSTWLLRVTLVPSEGP